MLCLVLGPRQKVPKSDFKSEFLCWNIFVCFFNEGKEVKSTSAFFTKIIFGKVNSVQEPCAIYFAVHILFEISETTWKNITKNIEMQDLFWKLIVWCSLLHFLCDLQDFKYNTWTAKHLLQASCTEFTLTSILKPLYLLKSWRGRL